MRQYVIDAFTDHVFAGNPAAVCVMDHWLDEKTMMAITNENNLPEAAFAVKEGEKYHLRWFLSGGEVSLCGHATLATACAIMTFVEPELTEITFTTLSGDLPVVRRGKAGVLRTVGAAFFMSLCIELVQPLLPTARTADITDLICNTAGALVGYGLYRPWKKHLRAWM